MIKKLLLITLLLTTATPAKALSSHEIRTLGVVGAGLILTSAGAHMLHRYQYEISHRVFDTFVGVALIAAGLCAIVRPDKTINFIERTFR